MEPLEVAREAARIAGETLLRYYQREAEFVYKETANLVSMADLAAERAVVAHVRKHFPGHEILAEEAHAGSAGADHAWVIDPLDGTANFLHGLPHFSVSIAYCRRGEVACGVVHQPVGDQWFEAERGGGARANGKPARVANQTRLNDALIALGFYYDRGAKMEATLSVIRDVLQAESHGVRRFGSAALDLVMVGGGMFAAFFEYELAPWDFAAGKLFVEEAGGRVSTCLGEPLPLAKSSILASNGALHAAMLEFTRKHAPRA